MAGAVVVLALLGAALAALLPASSGARGPAADGRGSGSHHGVWPSGSKAPADKPGPLGGRSGGQSQAGAASGRILTSCRAVAHVGDSTSVGMVSAADLPNAAQQLPAQYARVGVKATQVDAVGGRSVVETLPGTVNGYDAARAIASRGFRGCWVFALGTNDTANVAAGSTVSRPARIQELMALAHGQPVLWVNVKTLDISGAYAESNMQLWNAALGQAARQYPNLRIYDWAAAAQDGWFIPDGIHYTPDGYAMRAQLIADALAKAFPLGGESHGVYVR